MRISVYALAVLGNVLGSVTSGPLDPFKLWCLGTCSSDAKTLTTPGVVLMGGGVS